MTTTDWQNTNNQNDNDLNLNFDFILDENDQKKAETIKEEEVPNFWILQENGDIKESPSQENNIEKNENNKIQEVIIEQEIKTPETENNENINLNNSLEGTKTIESVAGEANTNEIENTKPEEVEIYQTSMENFNNTINKLNEAKEQWIQKISSEELQKQEIQETKDENIVSTESNIWVIDLDNILWKEEWETKIKEIKDNIIQKQEIQENINTTTESINNENNKNPYETITNQTNIDNDSSKKEHKKHLIKVIWITAACLLWWFFILKTMYPIQFNSDSSQENTNIENPVEENPFLQEPQPIAEEPVVEEPVIEESVVEESVIEETQDHNTTNEDIDPFQELDNIQTKDEIKKEETISLLQDYVNRWKEYLEIWNQTDNRDIIKYSTYIKVKWETYLKELETSETLDIQWLDTYIAQSSWYLIQLENLKNEELSKAETNSTWEKQEIQESQTSWSWETSWI